VSKIPTVSVRVYDVTGTTDVINVEK